MKHKVSLILLVLFMLLLAGCGGRVVTSGDYTLESGETLRGNLTVFSGDVNLEEDSRVTGNVFMTSGDLDANGEIDGNILLTSGNINLGDEAIVHGDILATSGNVRQPEGARVEGQVSTDPTSFAISGTLLAGLFGTFCILPLVLLALLTALVISLSRRRSEPAAQVQTPSSDPGQKLRQLQEMAERGLITEADYESKKAEILSRM